MRRSFVILIITALCVSVLACSWSKEYDVVQLEMNDANKTETKEQEESEVENSTATEKQTVYPLIVIDDTGEEVIIAKEPERIVSVSPSETEILFHLGLGDRVVGVTDFCDYPLEATNIPSIGGVSSPNEEAIIAAEPDLIIGGVSMKDPIAENLRGYDLTLYKAEPKTMDQIFAHILQIGLITNTQEEAEQLIAEMSEDVRYVTETVREIAEEERRKVYIEYNPGWTVGKGEFMDELITLAGAVNIAADTEGWIRIDEEKIIHDNPDTILYAKHQVDQSSGKTIDELIRSRNGWEQITAVQEGRLMPIDETYVSRTGPRITEGLLQIATSVYPELFQ